MSTTDPKQPGDAHGAPATGASDPDTGRHAVQRPAPTAPDSGPAPDPAPDPVVTPRAAAPRTGTPDTSASAGTSAPAPDTSPAAREAHADPDDELFPDPHAPRTPHGGTHVLGVLVGLVLAPLGVCLLLLGQSRILRVQVDGWDASLELLGIVLVSAGALVLAALLVLGLWTAAVPITAGLLLGLVGGLQLFAPGIARAATLDVVDADAWQLTVTQVTVAGTSGTTIVAGVLLLTAGVAVALARRHGVRLGAFRERNRAV